MAEYISFCFLTIGKLELVEIFLNFNEEMTSSSFGELDFNARLMNSIIVIKIFVLWFVYLYNGYIYNGLFSFNNFACNSFQISIYLVNRNFNVTNKIANTFNLKMVYKSLY